ncbi:MAG: acid phosphatase [Alphaproteobacteria bacterium]|nr:acid phosphatase [Alphaproteobacteria bacterium]
MLGNRFKFVTLAAMLGISAATPVQADDAGLSKIGTVVVIYAENRSFDNLYGQFPGAEGLQNLKPEQTQQLDRDGKPMAELPPSWGGLTAKDITPAVTEDQTRHLANAPYRIDDAKGFNLAYDKPTRDLWHRFYQEQMQIDGGKNNKFAAWADGGGAVMGTYDGSSLPLWAVAKKYVLADHFFMGAFGGSFLNHFMLVCACVPKYPDAANSPAKGKIAAVNEDGVSLKVKADSPASALQGTPKFENDGALTPDGYAVNTMAPPFQPSYVKPAAGGDAALADPADANTLPPQSLPHIGDLLTAKNVTWAWYAGAWNEALAGKGGGPVPNFQFHHQPFNYFADMAPGTPARAEHLKDGGLGGTEFLKDVDAGKLPQVAFYKPQGNLNEHPGYTDIASGDQHIADVISHLEKSPQWPGMLVVVTYDENGGFWDHVPPPAADRWGPGNRIPALIISPFAKMGTVDHTPYDTTSVLRFITRRFGLDTLAGITERDAALKAHSQPPLGDLTGALNLN